MNNKTTGLPRPFEKLVNEIPHIADQKFSNYLLKHVKSHASEVTNSLKDLPIIENEKAKSGILISAGPSVKRQNSIARIRDANYKGTITCVDGSYVACLKAGLIPDYVLTLDPYGPRVVRWFGDPNIEPNSENDDFFERQDLDVDFRNNTIRENNENIELVNKHASKTKAIVSSSSDYQVIKRLKDAGFDMYWWNPLIDDPTKEESITRQFHNINKLPCMNTGGNVGTAAWVFALTRLKLEKVALTGMDFSYYDDTPLRNTQGYYEMLKRVNGDTEKIKRYFTEFVFPLTNERFYTDPVFYSYRQNFFDLIKLDTDRRTYNCSEAGILFGENIQCMNLDDFLTQNA